MIWIEKVTKLSDFDSLKANLKVEFVDSPTIDEVVRAIHQMNSGRVSGNDGILAEIYKSAGPTPWRHFMVSWKTSKASYQKEVQQHDFCLRQHPGNLYRAEHDIILCLHIHDQDLTQSLWKVLERIGCSPKFVMILGLSHEGMTSQVLSISNVTDTFAIWNGVKQGYVLARFSSTYSSPAWCSKLSEI